MSDAWARRLASGEGIGEPVALVVAHPDDETLWCGAVLPRFTRALLIHLTDGAPRDMADAARLGFASRDAYAAARACELDEALALLGSRAERRSYNLVDKEAVDALDDLVARLVADLAGVAVVATHPYEGGHPDHDTAALAVRLAAARIAAAGGTPPALVEFASYYAADGARIFGRFHPDPNCPEHSRALDTAERVRIDAAIRAHASQAHVIADWRPDAERWRAAPAYDFTRPPPPGASLYDGFGWDLTSDRWRARVARC